MRTFRQDRDRDRWVLYILLSYLVGLPPLTISVARILRLIMMGWP